MNQTEQLDEQREHDRYSYETALRRLEDTLILESDQAVPSAHMSRFKHQRSIKCLYIVLQHSEPDPAANELTRLRHLCTIQATRLKYVQH